MDDADYATFEKAFSRLCGAFRLKLPKAEQVELTRTYFKVLDHFPLDDVLRVGRTLIETFKKFPSLADWITALGGMPENTPALDIRQMTASEVEERTRAEILRYTDAPCGCRDCVAAGVTDRPLRFVPTLWRGEEEERAWHPTRKRVEIVGHWAHGEELRRWYVARAGFFAKWGRHPAARTLALVTRQPGEDDE
jgi:hypothetical protein